jgi:hypothetical protein
MSHSDHEGVPDEDHQLAGGHRVALRLVRHRLQDDEQRVVVHLQLGPLVGGQGVLDGQRMQPELVGDQVELAFRRLVQADPQKTVATRACLREGVGEVLWGLRPLPVPVDGAIDDH